MVICFVDTVSDSDTCGRYYQQRQITMKRCFQIPTTVSINIKIPQESETVSTTTDYHEALFSNTDTVGIFNESDADTSFDFTKLMPINAGDRIDKH